MASTTLARHKDGSEMTPTALERQRENIRKRKKKKCHLLPAGFSKVEHKMALTSASVPREYPNRPLPLRLML